jgi:hypothetical protein
MGLMLKHASVSLCGFVSQTVSTCEIFILHRSATVFLRFLIHFYFCLAFPLLYFLHKISVCQTAGDFLDSIAADAPKGVWSVRLEDGGAIAQVRAGLCASSLSRLESMLLPFCCIVRSCSC